MDKIIADLKELLAHLFTALKDLLISKIGEIEIEV